MDAVVRERVDLFAAILEELKRTYRWSMDDLTQRFVALVCALEGKPFDRAAFAAAVRHIRTRTGAFSSYRGHAMYTTAALLVNRPGDPAADFDRMLAGHQALRAAGIPDGGYMPAAAYALLVTCPPEDVADRADRARTMYRLMRRHHRWLTGADHGPLAVLLAASDEEPEALIAAVEENYRALHEAGLYRGSGLHFLAHMLTLVPGTAAAKAEAVRATQDRLAGHRLRVSSTYYGTLGYLALLDAARLDGPDSAGEVVEVVADLRQRRHFRWAGRDMNVLAAAALVACPRLDALCRRDPWLQTGLQVAVNTMLAAQTAALTTAIAAASASTAASSAR